MERFKTALVGVVVTLLVLAGFGLGLMMLGFAILLGGVFALALRLAAPRIKDKAERQAREMERQMRSMEWAMHRDAA